MQDKNKLIEGSLVALRLMTEDDTDLIIKWRNNERVRASFIYREHFTRQIHENWIKTHIETGRAVQFIILEKKNGYRPVGSVYFRDIDNDKKTAEYGIFIGEDDAIGLGYGNETARLATSYAKDEMGLKTLILRAFSKNIPAIKSYEKAGFVKTKDLKAVECSDGFKGDMIMMENTL